MAFIFGVICGFTATVCIFYALAKKISKTKEEGGKDNGGDDKYYDCQ